jgi:CRISPR system Cascade subunit CasE
MGQQRNGNTISVYAELFEGQLLVVAPKRFSAALQTGIGHGRVMGLGLLSVVPVAG